jgi:hypothetical protein
MRTFRLAFLCAFAGALMACNVVSLHAAPSPTNVAAMKSMVADSSIQIQWVGWRGGWIISIPGAREVRFECRTDSTLPADLVQLGYPLSYEGEGQRIVVAQRVERISLNGRGEVITS